MEREGTSAGRGFGQFNDGKPVDETAIKTLLPCHEPAKAYDFVFTRYRLEAAAAG